MARPRRPAYRLSRFLRRNFAWVFSVTALSAGLGFSLFEYKQEVAARHASEALSQSLSAFASTLTEGLLTSDRASRNAEGVFYARLAYQFEELAAHDENQRGELLHYAIQYLESACAEFERSGEHALAAQGREHLGVVKNRAATQRGSTLQIPTLQAGNPALANSYYTLGQMLARAGDTAGAARAYHACASIARDVSPAEPESKRLLGACQSSEAATTGRRRRATSE